MEGAKVTESLNEWEQIQSPTTQSREWEMVLGRDHSNNENKHLQHDLTMFPPSNHEGLQIPPSPTPPPPPSPTPPLPESETPSQPSSAVVSSVEGEERLQPGSKPKVVGNEIGNLLRSGIVWMASRVRCYVVSRGGFYSFASVTVVVAAVLLFSKVHRWRQWIREERKNHFILLIKEKDQVPCQFNHLLLCFFSDLLGYIRT